MHVEESVVINRPPEEVFDYVANRENLPEWSSPIQEVRKETQGPLVEEGALLGLDLTTPGGSRGWQRSRRPLAGACLFPRSLLRASFAILLFRAAWNPSGSTLSTLKA